MSCKTKTSFQGPIHRQLFNSNQPVLATTLVQQLGQALEGENKLTKDSDASIIHVQHITALEQPVLEGNHAVKIRLRFRKNQIVCMFAPYRSVNCHH
jgi:hypothetical protein